MAEMNAFERRVADTLLWHADEASPTLDAATVARRAALGHPRRAGSGLLPWRVVAMPRVAWLLLLAGLLLAALVGGTLLVGSQPERRLPAVVPPVGRRLPALVPPVGQLYVCPPGSVPDQPGPVDQARPVIGDGIAAMVFDRHAAKIVLLAQLLEGIETWTFDVCTNTWTRMHPQREPGSPQGEATHLIYDVDSDATIAIDGASTWVYDLAADTWTRMGAAPVVRQWNTLTWTYDPVSGLVFAADAGELWSYDVETDGWALVSAVPWRAGEGSLAYDASVDRIVAYAERGKMWLFDIRTGTWSKSGADTPEVVCGMGWPNAAPVYDEVTERTVVSCNITVAYHATADRWESLPDDAGPFGVYDAANKRFVGLQDDVVVAFDPATRERMVLVAAGNGQPTPRSE